jgi:serine/threonine protein kinase
MELMSGGSLQNLLESVGNLPETSIKSLALQTLEAIHELHSKLHTPHGVISPSQILIDKNGNVKVNY